MIDRTPRALALVLLLVPLSAAAPAHAEVTVGGKVGTLGLGAEVAFGLSDQLNLRLAASAADHDLDYEAGGIDWEGSLDLASAAALLDWHPGGGRFRLTAGALFNDNTLEGRAPLRTLLEREIGPRPPDLEVGTLVGTAEGDSVSPYLALGVSHRPRDTGISFTFELGAVFQGSPDVTLEVDTPLPIDAVPGGRALVDRLLAEEERELEAEAEDYEVYPVLSFGIGYRF